MSSPYMNIDLFKIEENARVIVELCNKNNIKVHGVTKVMSGHPDIAISMLRGGVYGLADSRLDNFDRIYNAGIDAHRLLLRLPHMSEAERIVNTVDMSLNSDIEVIEELAFFADEKRKEHDIILMIDLGDLREGVWADELIPMVTEIRKMRGVNIAGIGTNLTCYGGVIPTEQNLQQLVDYAKEIESKFNFKLRYISGGNSSSLPLLASGKMPKEINHLRIGEAIVLGRETVNRTAWPDTYQDAITLKAEVIECREKPSVPIGEIGQDAFGNKPVFEEKGKMIRAICNIGRQDTNISNITPLDSAISILGGSSDHLLLDVTNADPKIKVGEMINFDVDYGSLLGAMTSPYIEKRFID